MKKFRSYGKFGFFEGWQANPVTDQPVAEPATSSEIPKKTIDQFSINPLDVNKHDRKQFSCGVEQIDNFFKVTARKMADAGTRGTFVMTSSDGEVIGFYATNMHTIQYTDLPSKYKRVAPKDGSIPAAYFSIVGVDKKFQSRGYGSVMLVDALKKFVESAHLGIAVVILDVFDCGDPKIVARRKRLYEDFGFQSIPLNELRMFMPISTAASLVKEHTTTN